MIDFPNSPSVGQIFVSGGVAWRWDGVKWSTSGSTAPGSGLAVNAIVPASGSTVVLTDYRPVFINNAAPLALLTIKLPASPTSISYVEISFNAPVTTLIIQDGAGAAISGAPLSAYGPGAALEFRFTGTSWAYWK